MSLMINKGVFKLDTLDFKIKNIKIVYWILGAIWISVSTMTAVGLARSELILESVQTSYSVLQDFIHINSRLNENILKTRFQLLSNYDAISADLTKGKQLIQSLSNDHFRLSPGNTELLKAFEDKTSLVENFKGKNAIYRNSWNYFPEAIAAVNRNTQESSHSLKLKSDSILKEVLLYGDHANSDRDEDLKARILELRAALASYSLGKNTSEISRIETALSHASVIVEQRPTLDHLVMKIIEHPVAGEAEELFEFYNNQYENLKYQRTRFKQSVFICMVVLLIALFFQGRRLKQTAQDLEALNYQLEDRVRQRALVIEKQQAQLSASAKLSALGEMAGGVAHEINNPLAIIVAKTGQMRQRLGRLSTDPEKLRADLEKIESTAERISKIVKGLRIFSRNAENDPTEKAAISKIIEDTVALCGERFKHHAIDLKVNCTFDAMVNCRPAQISQVVMNLLSNGHDAVLGLPVCWVALETVLTEKSIQILVSDSGPGVPPELLDKIMKPFFTTKEVGKGTGLGLSISAGIAADHGGSIRYAGAKGQSLFIFELPIALNE